VIKKAVRTLYCWACERKPHFSRLTWRGRVRRRKRRTGKKRREGQEGVGGGIQEEGPGKGKLQLLRGVNTAKPSFFESHKRKEESMGE